MMTKREAANRGRSLANSIDDLLEDFAVKIANCTPKKQTEYISDFINGFGFDARRIIRVQIKLGSMTPGEYRKKFGR